MESEHCAHTQVGAGGAGAVCALLHRAQDFPCLMQLPQQGLITRQSTHSDRKSVYHVVELVLHLYVFELVSTCKHCDCRGCTVNGSLGLLWNEKCFSENLPPGRSQERVRFTCSIITNLFSTNLKI